MTTEKTFWKWLVKKGVDGVRLEGCCVKGIPDVMVALPDTTPQLIELKCWDGGKNHPLLVEQYNLLNKFGGLVLIKINRELAVLCKPARELLVSDISFAKRNGHPLDLRGFSPEALSTAIGRLKDDSD